jgi:hypothetical protein
MKDLSFETNLYAQLIGGQYEIEAKLKTKQKYLKTAEENKKTAEENKNSGLQVDLTEDSWIYDYTRAIILSYISQ